MTAVYPNIPGPQRFGKVKFATMLKEIPVLGGRPIRRRVSSRYKLEQALEWIFSESEFNTWALFVRDTLSFTGDFNLRTFGPDGIKPRSVYLVGGKYDFVPLGNGPVKVSAVVRWDQGDVRENVDFVYGGSSSIVHADFVNAGDSATAHPDFIKGGSS